MNQLSNLSIVNIGQNYRVVGGSDVYLLALEKLLLRFGNEVIPFAASHEQNLQTGWSRFFPPGADFEQPGIRDLFRYIYSLPARRSMAKLLRAKHFDLAHMHIYYGKLTSSILAPLRSRGIPIVQTLHEYKLVCPTYQLLAHGEICEACNGRNFWRAVQTCCNRGSYARSLLSALESYVSLFCGNITGVDHFIAVSDFLRRKVIQLGLPSEKVTTVHNFIDAGAITPNYQPGGHFIYYGRMEQVKGLFTLIEAFRTLRDERLFLVGGGTALPDLQRVIERDGLNHIQILGFKSGAELESLIRNSICTITPSLWYETFGLTLIESFAHGRPVIASRIGGMTEVITDGVDGFLVTPGDVASLREKILWMSANRRCASEMGEMGRKKVEECFNPENHYAQLREVYRKVIGK